MTESESNLGKQLRSIRKRTGIRDTELADNMSVTRVAVNHWESGRRTPSLIQTTRILDFAQATDEERQEVARILNVLPEDISIAFNNQVELMDFVVKRLGSLNQQQRSITKQIGDLEMLISREMILPSHLQQTETAQVFPNVTALRADDI